MTLIFAGLASNAVAQGYPEFPGKRLVEGRQLWLGTCEGCHAYGIAGAPNPKDVKAWQPRLTKNRKTLYQHAIEGFFGKSGTMMPPRGGNDELTDDQVKLAVDYMVALAEFYADVE